MIHGVGLGRAIAPKAFRTRSRMHYGPKGLNTLSPATTKTFFIHRPWLRRRLRRGEFHRLHRLRGKNVPADAADDLSAA